MLPETITNIPIQQVTVEGFLNKEYDLSESPQKLK